MKTGYKVEQKMKKSLVQIVSNIIFCQDSGYPKFEFRVGIVPQLLLSKKFHCRKIGILKIYENKTVNLILSLIVL